MRFKTIFTVITACLFLIALSASPAFSQANQQQGQAQGGEEEVLGTEEAPAEEGQDVDRGVYGEEDEAEREYYGGEQEQDERGYYGKEQGQESGEEGAVGEEEGGQQEQNGGGFFDFGGEDEGGQKKDEQQQEDDGWF